MNYFALRYSFVYFLGLKYKFKLKENVQNVTLVHCWFHTSHSSFSIINVSEFREFIDFPLTIRDLGTDYTDEKDHQ